MPKLKTAESRVKYWDFGDLKRNLKKMTIEDMDRYVSGESLTKILGEKYIKRRI